MARKRKDLERRQKQLREAAERQANSIAGFLLLDRADQEWEILQLLKQQERRQKRGK